MSLRAKRANRADKPQSLFTSFRATAEGTANLVVNTVGTFNETMDLAGNAVSAINAKMKLGDTAEFSLTKAEELTVFFDLIEELEARENQTELVKQQIALHQETIKTISQIKIEYRN